MSEGEFNGFMLAVFFATVIAVAIGFAFFMKWRRGVISTVTPREELERRAAEMDERFRRKHPELEEESDKS